MGTMFLQQRSEDAHEGHGGGDLAIPRAFEHGAERGKLRDHQRLRDDLAPRQIATERLALLVQVFHFRRVVGRLDQRKLGNLFVGERDVEAAAENRFQDS